MRFRILTLTLTVLVGCASMEPYGRTDRTVLSSRQEVSAPSKDKIDIVLGGDTPDGVVTGNVQQVYTCTKTDYNDVRITNTTGGTLHDVGWPLAGAAALGIPGVFLLASAHTYSDKQSSDGSASSRTSAYIYGSALTAMSAALLAHVTYLWIKSLESESSYEDKEHVTGPPAECKREPVAGIDVGLQGRGDLAKVTTDGTGAFRFDLASMSGALPLAQAAPVLTLRAGDETKTVKPASWWAGRVAGLRAELDRRLAQEQQSCDKGALSECTKLGLDYKDDEGGFGIKDGARAKSLFDKACRGGDSEGCFQFGLAHLADGDDNQASVAKAYRFACDHKIPEACNNLGVMYEYGRGEVTASLKTALELYERGCAADLAKACENRDRARQLKDQQDVVDRRNAEVAEFRRTVHSGSDSHCGLVVEVNGPVAKVQSMIGETWLKVEQLYPQGYAPCNFYNNVYQDPYY